MSKQNPPATNPAANPPATPSAGKPPENPPAPPADDAKPTAAKKPRVLSERKLEDGGVVRVVTDGVRTWKEAPEGSGLGPRK